METTSATLANGWRFGSPVPPVVQPSTRQVACTWVAGQCSWPETPEACLTVGLKIIRYKWTHTSFLLIKYSTVMNMNELWSAVRPAVFGVPGRGARLERFLHHHSDAEITAQPSSSPLLS